MRFESVDDLRPLYTRDRKVQQAFFVAYRYLVAVIARDINTRTPALDVKDVAAELWRHVTADNWAMIRKYSGIGSFEGYFKKCLSFKAIDLGRKFTSHDKMTFVRLGEDADCFDAGSSLQAAFIEKMFDTAYPRRNSMDIPAESSSEVDGDYRELLLSIMRECIETLPAEDRLLIKMSVYDGATVEQIAAVLGLACPGTCYTRKNRIIAKLRVLCSERL